ncbi:DnaB-like helicase C-terminal domain-containing protein [Peptostreptococcus faecalis]|uniref:DnaB-like helicase C-terminal domain-containing protein n=1 Tax=Peptostreptococcus faecalis TaxID=2045015 RepID=UPI000C7D151B|nr:DnaB-like helicase C-terminal domain-containing protein [Peptostreptococcus faecalis]
MEREFPETQAICCIFKDLTLLDDYTIPDSYFKSIEYSILWRIAKQLKKENYNSATQLEVKGRLSEEERTYFLDNEVWRVLSNYEDIANTQNFLNYIDKICKNDIYLTLCDMGMDLFKEYDFEGTKIVPFEFFKKMSSQEIKEFYEYHVNNFGIVDIDKGIKETVIDFTEEYIESTLSGQETGTHFDISGIDINGNDIIAFPKTSYEANGLIEGSFSVLAGYSSVGKSMLVVPLTMAMVYRGEKVVICSNEQSVKPFLDNFLMWTLHEKLKYKNINKKKLKEGRSALTDKDIEMLEKARKIWDEEYKGKIHFIALPTAKMEYVEKKFREYHLKHGCTFFIYDTFKMDFDNKRESAWIGLIEDSRRLADFANKYESSNVKVFATMQCAPHTKGRLFLDENALSNSKQVKEVCQNLFLIRDIYEEEMQEDNKKYYCNPYTARKEVNEKGIEVYNSDPYYLDPNKNYKVLFLDKLREGKNSHQGNYAVILEAEGDNGTLREVCLCKPQRKNINAN